MTENTEYEPDTKKHLMIISGICVILLFVLPVVSLWWWAVLGMTEAVGTAVMGTIVVIFLFAWICKSAADNLDQS